MPCSTPCSTIMAFLLQSVLLEHEASWPLLAGFFVSELILKAECLRCIRVLGSIAWEIARHQQLKIPGECLAGFTLPWKLDDIGIHPWKSWNSADFPKKIYSMKLALLIRFQVILPVAFVGAVNTLVSVYAAHSAGDMYLCRGDGRWCSWVNLEHEPTLGRWELRTVFVSWGSCPTLAGFLGWRFMMFQPEQSFSSSLFVKYRYLHLSSQHGNTALPKVCWTPKLPKRIEQYFRHFQDDLYFMFPDICQNGWCFVTFT